MTDLARIEPPENCMYADAETLNITLAADPDGSLNFGLLITAPPPLGAIRVRLCREHVMGLREKLNDLGALDAAEVADIMARIRGQHPPTD